MGIYFVIYLLLETLVSVEVSSQIGGLNTFIEMVFTLFIGVLIMRNFKSIIFFNLGELVSGTMNIQEFKNRNLFPLIGAVLLVIPGFLTDFIGILMQFSFLTAFILRGGSINRPTPEPREGDYQWSREDNIIDIEELREQQGLKK
jgi:2-isopropylmalate synthase/UPF0716 protein FxsA